MKLSRRTVGKMAAATAVTFATPALARRKKTMLLELGEGQFGVNDEPLASWLPQAKNSHNATLVGKGPGVTEIYGKMRFDKWYPNLSGFSHYSDGNEGWALLEINNPGTPRIVDVWSHPAANSVGIVIRVTDWGGGPQPGWPPRNSPVGEPRATQGILRDVFVYGEGYGIRLTTELSPQTTGFINHIHLDNGHIYTDQMAIAVENVPQVSIRNFHIDVKHDHAGLKVSGNSTVTWFAPGFIEPTTEIRNNGGTIIEGDGRFVTVGDWPVVRSF